MKINLRVILGIGILILPLFLKAQDTTKVQQEVKPAIEYKKGEKHIYVDRLGFSPNMTVMELLQIFPELTMRGSDDVMNNYTVILDDYTLGVNRDILSQITIGELSKITISDNPSASCERYGTGGTIELDSKPIEEGLSGNVQLDASTERNLLASTNVNYKTDKVKIRTFLKGDSYDFLERYNINSMNGNEVLNRYSYQNINKSARQYAKFDIDYSMTDNDVLRFSLWEGYQKDASESFYMLQTPSGSVGYNFDTLYNTNLNTLARLKYTHFFKNKHQFVVETKYNFTNKKIWEEDLFINQPHDFSLKLQYKGNIVEKDGHRLFMDVSTTGGYNCFVTKQEGSTPQKLQNTANLNPSLEFSYYFKQKVFARVGSKYYYQAFYAEQNGQRRSCGDYLLNADLQYSPVEAHTIRVDGRRDRLAFSNGERTGYYAGGSLSYIFQQLFANSHYLNITASLQYNRVQRLAGTSNDLFAVKAGVVWQYKVLCLSLVGYLYDNQQYRNGQGYLDYHAYYNLRITPILNLNRGWSMSASLMYNSLLVSDYYTNGDYCYASLRLGKRIGNWTIHVEWSDPFHYMTEDNYYIQTALDSQGQTSSDPLLVQSMYYYPYHRYVNLGVMYSF